MNEQRSRKVKEKTPINWWKWAFLSLISVVILGIVLLVSALQPVTIEEADTETPVEFKDDVSLVSIITKEDAVFIMNNSFEAMMTDSQLSYEVVLDDQLEIRSTVNLFNLQIPYTLFFTPYVTENGNLQLRAEAIELASFSLPVSAVLSLLAGELELPFYIGVDSAAKLIVIDFNELSRQQDIGIAMEKIDLENNEIQLKLSVNQATLIKGLNFKED